MILWTVMPLELVFAQEEAAISYDEIDYNGVRLLVEKTAPAECRIVRIISTNPVDFLRSDLQPGNTIYYKPY